jgi:hypothetical protein
LETGAKREGDFDEGNPPKSPLERGTLMRKEDFDEKGGL